MNKLNVELLEELRNIDTDSRDITEAIERLKNNFEGDNKQLAADIKEEIEYYTKQVNKINIENENLLDKLSTLELNMNRDAEATTEHYRNNFTDDNEALKESLIEAIETIELEKTIINEVEKEVLRTGTMGTETVRVTIQLSDQEAKLFHNIDLADNYDWNFEDSNTLFITYSEE